MNLDLTGKNALVCGSTQGLGWATAVELALLGASVTLLARNPEKLRIRLGELPRPQNQTHGYVVADFADPAQVRAAVGEALAAVDTLHILVNNTGGPAGGPVFDAAPEAFSTAFAAHLLNNHALVQAVVPGMKAAGYGRIVNVISTSVKQPIPGLGVSNTIRAAVANWAKTLAGELGPFGITVNNVLPGYTETTRLDEVLGQRADREGKKLEELKAETAKDIPVGRIGRPEEFGAAAAFLCTPAAAYINGINLPVDGGRLGSL
jgi:3-oxoacyl-[acyl-carrier protein] reductase